MISDGNSIKNLSSRLSGASYWSPAIGKQGGVCVLINENFDGKVLSWLKDSSERILSLLISYASTTINLVNIYAPTNLTDRKSFFENLHHLFLPADIVIVGGDFNCYENELDNFGGNINNAKYLSDFKTTFKLQL